MGPNPQFPADLVAFTKEILNGILHLLCGVNKITNISTTIKFRKRNGIKEMETSADFLLLLF